MTVGPLATSSRCATTAILRGNVVLHMLPRIVLRSGAA